MSLVTQSKVRNRVYQRAFDHDEAKRLRSEGWTYQALADHFGVSITGVQRVLLPKVRDSMAVQTKAWTKKNLNHPCKGGCGKTAWTHKGRSGYCPACNGIRQTLDDVRSDELRCTKCGEWKADAEFCSEDRASRRGHKSWCRKCESASRKKNRRENRERENRADRKRKRQEATKKGHQMSEYLVLRKGDESWSEVKATEARSVLHAIEEVADREGTYAAVKLGQVKDVRITQAFKVA